MSTITPEMYSVEALECWYERSEQRAPVDDGLGAARGAFHALVIEAAMVATAALVIMAVLRMAGK